MTQTLYRIASTSPSYNYDDLTGTGAAKSGGRWNRVNTPVVYTAANVALATLETIVHIDTPAWPLNRYLLEISVPENLWLAAEDPRALSTLPPVWDSHPAPKETTDFGDLWIREKRSVLLIVPSTVIPMENNVLINPLHPDAVHIKLTRTTKFTYDSRLRP